MIPTPSLALLVLLSGCGRSGTSASSPADAATAAQTVRVSLDVDADQSRYKPSFAVWAVAGGRTTPLFVTRKAAEKKYWGGEPRPENLPVWDGVAQGSVDAVSGATPRSGVYEVTWVPPAEARNGPVDVFVEVNAAFDTNEAWPDEGGVNGQPSLVWKATLPALPDAPVTVDAVLVGHGHLRGSDARVDPDLSGFTTAASLLRSVRVTWQP